MKPMLIYNSLSLWCWFTLFPFPLVVNRDANCVVVLAHER